MIPLTFKHAVSADDSSHDAEHHEAMQAIRRWARTHLQENAR